jgi:glycogen debranching enzyme
MTSAVADRPKDSEWANPFAIAVTDKTSSYRPRVLKQGDTFLVVDPFGDMQAREPCAEGLFHEDTRYLSHLSLSVNGHQPLLLSSNITSDNLSLAIDLTNPDVSEQKRLTLPKDTLHVLRSKTLGESACHETIRVRNYAQETIAVDLVLRFGADFADIFEVRGQARPRRGSILQPG